MRVVTAARLERSKTQWGDECLLVNWGARCFVYITLTSTIPVACVAIIAELTGRVWILNGGTRQVSGAADCSDAPRTGKSRLRDSPLRRGTRSRGAHRWAAKGRAVFSIHAVAFTAASSSHRLVPKLRRSPSRATGLRIEFGSHFLC